MKHSEAVKIVIEICIKIKGICEQLEVAGSVRRLKDDVKDIEVVACIPKPFRTRLYCIMDELCYHKKGQADGKYMQWYHKGTGIVIDLFLPAKDDFFRQLAIRTGSADFTRDKIATGWVKLGWVGTDNGLRRQSQCIKKSGKWICTAQDPELPPVWKSEEEFFKWLGLAWVEPDLRN